MQNARQRRKVQNANRGNIRPQTGQTDRETNRQTDEPNVRHTPMGKDIFTPKRTTDSDKRHM